MNEDLYHAWIEQTPGNVLVNIIITTSGTTRHTGLLIPCSITSYEVYPCQKEIKSKSNQASRCNYMFTGNAGNTESCPVTLGAYLAKSRRWEILLDK